MRKPPPQYILYCVNGGEKEIVTITTNMYFVFKFFYMMIHGKLQSILIWKPKFNTNKGYCVYFLCLLFSFYIILQGRHVKSILKLFDPCWLHVYIDTIYYIFPRYLDAQNRD